MKKRAQRYDTPKHHTTRAQQSTRRNTSSLRWIIISAMCLSALICLIGVANAASASSGSATQAAKDQTLQRLLDIGKTHIGAKTGDHQQAAFSQPAPVRQAGIVNMHQGPFLTSTFTVRNVWQGPVGNDWVLAYSGATLTSNGESALGGIVLYTETINAQGGFDMHPLGTFLAPAGTTALTITQVNGTLLQVQSDSGTHLTFDLVAHQFY